MIKPCAYVHGDFKEGCEVCIKYRDHPERYARDRETAGSIPITWLGESTEPGWVIKIKKRACKSVDCPWLWAVLLDGVVKDHGEAKTEEQARTEAEKSAAELRSLME